MSQFDLEKRAKTGAIAAQLDLADRCDAAGDAQQATHWLGAAARRGSLVALAQLGARTVVGAGCTADPEAGRALLEFAAGSGSTQAARHLAVLQLSRGEVDQGMAHACAAAAAGDPAVAGELAAIVGGHRDWSKAGAVDELQRRARALVEAEACEILSDDPVVTRLPGALSPGVCAWLRAWCEPVLTRAETIDRRSGLALIEAARTNRYARLGIFDQPLELLLFKLRLARTVEEPVEHFEGTNVLAYEPGQSFSAHHDYLDPAEAGFAADLAASGQRVATVLVALNRDYTGGETVFPQLGLSWRGAEGDALYFRNVDRHHAPNRRTLHAGAPPKSGRKWLLSQWVRDRAQPIG